MLYSCALQAGCKFADLLGAFGFLIRHPWYGQIGSATSCSASFAQNKNMLLKVPGNWHAQFTSASR